MKYNIEIECDKENIDACLFKVYLDIKKKIYIKKQPLPKVLTKLDCECESSIKYCVR